MNRQDGHTKITWPASSELFLLAGVKGDAPGGDGVQGFTQDSNRSGVVGTNTGAGNGLLGQSAQGIGLVARGGRLAGLFDGNVELNGEIRGRTIEAQLNRIVRLEQKVQAMGQLEQRVQVLQNQLDTAVSNLTARVSTVEFQANGLQSISHTHG